MIKAIVTDLSRVLLLPLDKSYKGKLNTLHESLFKNKEYNFWDHFELNKDLFNFYKELSEVVSMYLFTTRYIQEYPPLKENIDSLFSKVFIATELNLKKDHENAYLTLAKLLEIEPGEILYIDDSMANIEAAQKAGVKVVLYTNNKQTLEGIENVLKQ